MLLSVFLLSQLLVAGVSAQFPPEKVSTISLSAKGDVGGQAKTTDNERFWMSMEYFGSGSGIIANHAALTTNYTAFNGSVPSTSSLRRLRFRLSSTSVVAIKGQNVQKAATVDLSNVLVNGVKVPPNGMFLFQGTTQMNIPTGPFKLPGITEYALSFSKARPNTTACDNASVANKICFSLRGIVGESIPGQAEFVNIGYYDGKGRAVLLYPEFDLKRAPTRFIIQPDSSTDKNWIASVFIRFSNDETVQPTDKKQNRAVYLDVNSVFINGTRVPGHRLMGGDYFNRLAATIRSDGGLIFPNDHAEAIRLAQVLAGNFSVGAEYRLVPPRQPVDSSVCKDTEKRKNAICFNLRGQIGLRVPREQEAVTISYVDEKGNKKPVYQNIFLSEFNERFAVVPQGSDKVTSVVVNFNNDRCCWAWNNQTWDRNVLFDVRSVVWNGVHIANISNGIGGPIYDRFDRPNDSPSLQRAMMLKNTGLFAWASEYTFTLYGTGQNQTTLETRCLNGPFHNLVCLKLRGQQGESRPSDTEYVDVGYILQGSGKIEWIYKLLPLTKAYRMLALPIRSGTTVEKIVVRFKNDAMYKDGNGMIDRNVLLDVNSVTLNGKPINVLNRMGGPMYDDWIRRKDWLRANLVAKGIWAWQADYHINLISSLDGTECTERNASGHLCFSMKALLGVDQVADGGEVIQLIDTSNTSNSTNSTNSTLGIFHVASNWTQIRLPLDKLKSISVKHLNPRINVTRVDVDLKSFIRQGFKYTDDSQCFDVVPVKGELGMLLN